jgi:hypothetical protein
MKTYNKYVRNGNINTTTLNSNAHESTDKKREKLAFFG